MKYVRMYVFRLEITMIRGYGVMAEPKPLRYLQTREPERVRVQTTKFQLKDRLRRHSANDSGLFKLFVQNMNLSYMLLECSPKN